MKARFLMASLLLLSLGVGLAAPVAGAPRPPAPDEHRPEGRAGPHSGPRQVGPDGLWVAPADYRPEGGARPDGTGGPDDFGYTWVDPVANDWIDASNGTDPGLDPDYNYYEGPIDIGFPFKYYENSYSQLYITVWGYVSFGQSYLYDSQGRIPSAEPPNDVVAPHWVPVDRIDGYIRYKTGGTTPNRWFVVEWNHVVGLYDSDEDVYTFEVVLHENGDIWFQYGDLSQNNWRWCESSGIEDSVGLDGLSVTPYCNIINPYHAVHIDRPAPAARVKVWPLYYGGFGHGGDTADMQIPVRNTGELGADTYDLTWSSAWPVSFFAADGTTPLADTDSDGVPDTGPVAQGSTFQVVAKVAVPSGAAVGDSNTTLLTVRSSLDTSKSKTPTLQAAVPAPFAQAYQDTADGAMTLELVQPGLRVVSKAAPDWTYGYYPSVAETPAGFVYVWSDYTWYDPFSTYELWYALVDSLGQEVVPATKLTDHSGATFHTYDDYPAVAVTPDGRTGVLWYRDLYDNDTHDVNYNIWFAILDASGSVSYGPANLTNNQEWGYWGDYWWPRFYDPALAATADNRFVLAWEREYEAPPEGNCTSYCYVEDIYYAVLNGSGGSVKPISRFTFDTPGDYNEAYYPNLAALSGSRALLTWTQNETDDVHYAVLNSDGWLVKDRTNLSADGISSYDYRPDALQLSGGKALIAWTGYSYPAYAIRYALLDSAYNRVYGPASIDNPAAPQGSDYVSAAADASDHAILTWADYSYYDRSRLYYALVGSSGSLRTPAMLLHTSPGSDDRVYTSYSGFSNTSWSREVAPEVDGYAAFLAAAGGPPGGTGTLSVQYGNQGLTTAQNVQLVATLDPALTYLGDTSGITPSVVGSEVTWELPNLGFDEGGSFQVFVGLPAGAEYGTTYPVSLEFVSDGPEANPADNTDSTELMIARQVFLPLALRAH